jgi:hypothetical protein
MVITYSLAAGHDNSASTKATVWRVVDDANRQLGTNVAPPCIVPHPLIGQDDTGLDRPGETWPSQWNHCDGKDPNPCRSDIKETWPVEKYTILGNLIVVGFNSSTVREASCGKGCSEPAHVFQDWWVHRQVWKDVLAPRWQITCTHPTENTMVQGNVVTQNSSSRATSSAAIAPAYTSSSLFPKTSIRRNPANTRTIIRKGLKGFGDDGLQWCGVEGVVSELFSADEWQGLAWKQYVVPALIVGLGLGVLYLMESK